MKENKKVVLFALFANLSIALAKLFVYFATRSSSMFSEAIHSIADTGNQILLLVGIKRSLKKEDELHPFGYSKERFFWAFVVAIQLFVLGGVYSLYEGVHKITHLHALKHYWLAISLLIFAICAEGISFLKAKKAVDRRREALSTFSFLKRNYDAEITVVFLEDLAAISGLSIALVAVSLAWITGNPIFDGFGSIFIGVILIIVAYLLGAKMKSLMIGEAAPENVLSYIKELFSEFECVDRVIYFKSMVLGSDSILLAGKVAFKEGTHLEEISSTIDRVEERVRNRFPEVKRIYIEPDIFKV